MADKKTLGQMFKLLRANWPKEPYSEDKFTVYWRCLGDIPDEVLKAATVHCISTLTFFPKVNELRRAAFDIMANKYALPTASEAWGRVSKAMSRRGGFFRNGKHHEPKPLYPFLERAVKAVGGWDVLSMSENYVADRARFIQAYDAILARESENLRMLPQVRELAEKLLLDRVGQIEGPVDKEKAGGNGGT